MGAVGEDWHLASGLWRRESDANRWSPIARADGRTISSRLSPAERLALVSTSFDKFVSTSTEKLEKPATGSSTSYPPEFSYSPDTGQKLESPIIAKTAPWVPPFGNSSDDQSTVRGLHQTRVALELTQRPLVTNAPRRSQTDDADRQLTMPPPGQYEFAVGRFGTAVDVLLAIEPEKGALFVVVNPSHASQRWEALAHEGGGVIAEASLPASCWKAETARDGDDTLLCLPTTSGLAIVRADALSLSYSVNYVGGGRVIGAPITWDGEAWAAVDAGQGLISFGIASVDGGSSRVLTSDVKSTLLPAGEALHAPVCDTQQVVWPGSSGQLVVRKDTTGTPRISWVEWPAATRPNFQFGSAYLSGAGRFWQLSWNKADESYVYVEMARTPAEVVPTISPALCSGRISYKMSARMKSDPWADVDDSQDASSNEVVLPIVESTSHAAVLGLVIEARSGIAALLRSSEKQRTVLQIQSDNRPDVRFHTFNAAVPWRARAFVFDDHLWLYHPQLRAMLGFALVASVA